MKVERQGYFECILATLAALRGVSLDEVRREANIIDGYSWYSFLQSQPSKAEKVIEELAGPFWSLINPLLDMRQSTPGQSELPRKGRGAVLVKCVGGRHIMPWEDGLVYDPENPDEPLPLKEYLTRSGNTLLSFTQEKE